MKISVIIPTYNRAHLISRAIDSALNQTSLPFEIIIINDGSTDDTRNVLKKYNSRIRTISTENCGVSHARNIGIKAAQGNWLAFLDSDDEWKSNKLARQKNEIGKKAKTVFCHTDELWIRNGKRINQMKKHKKYGGWVFNKNLERCLISPSTVLMKKELIHSIGYFDTTFPICEDYDLWLKVTSQFPILFVDEPLVEKYGGHKDQLSLQTNKIELYRIKALSHILENSLLSQLNERAVLETLIKKCNIFLSGALKRHHQNHTREMTDKIEFYSKRLNDLKASSNASL